jgi:hypothetical protein
VCGCFKPDTNPGAPSEVLFGRADESPDINKAADMAFEQGTMGISIPVFLKKGANEWEYRGQYLCVGITRDKRVVARKMAQHPERGQFHGLLRFESVEPWQSHDSQGPSE